VTWLAIGLALINSCCFTAGTWLQYAVAVRTPSLSAAARRPRWLAGLALLGAGATCQVTALSLAPVSVVEPAGVLGIVFTVMLGLRVRGARLDRRTALALVAVLVGVGSFAVLAALHTVPTEIGTESLIVAGAGVAGVVVICLLLGNVLDGRARCLAMGVGGGTAYGCTSTFVRAATERFTTHGVDLTLLGMLGGLVATVLTGFWLVQRAHADGPPESTVANLTVMDPLVAVGIGVGLLGEAPGLTMPIAGLGIAAALIAIVGVVYLYRTVPPYLPSLSSSSSSPTPTSPRQETTPCHPSA